MSTIKDEALQCKLELDSAYLKRRELRAEFSTQKAELAQRHLAGQDTSEIAYKIHETEKAVYEQERLVEKAGLDFRTAIKNLEAERKLEEEAREAEDQQVQQQEHTRQSIKDIEVDDLDL